MNAARKSICPKLAFSGLVLSAALVLALGSVKAAPAGESDSEGVSRPEVIFPPGLSAARAKQIPIPTDTIQIFFTPQDENTSCTVLFLVNTKKSDQVVKLTTFRTNGTVYLRTAIPVPGISVVRVVSDTVSTAAGSWQNPILANFTTNSAYGRLVVPSGVIVEGYVAWNGGSTFDPLDVVPTLPMRFWTR